MRLPSSRLAREDEHATGITRERRRLEHSVEILKRIFSFTDAMCEIVSIAVATARCSIPLTACLYRCIFTQEMFNSIQCLLGLPDVRNPLVCVPPHRGLCRQFSLDGVDTGKSISRYRACYVNFPGAVGVVSHDIKFRGGLNPLV